MSRHFYQTQGLRVVSGWDRPLQHYFLTIEKLEPAEDEDEFIYSDMDEHGINGMTLDMVKAKIKEFKLPVPAKFFENIESDRYEQIGGNKVVNYGIIK